MPSLPRLVQAAACFAAALALALPDGLFAAIAALLVLLLRAGPGLLPFLLAGHLTAALARPAEPSLPRLPVALRVRVAHATWSTTTGGHASLVELEDESDRAHAGAATCLLLERSSAPLRARGDRLSVEGELVPAPPPRNPGVRRERARLFAARSYPCRDEDRSVGAAWRGLRGALDRLGNAIDRRLRERLPPRAAALADGLVIGRADELEPAFKQGLRAIGAWHFLAVSGSHVAIVAALLTALFALLRLPERAARILTLLAVLAYAGLSGGEAPAFRSAIGCVGAALVVGRSRMPSAPSWLAAAFLAIVALDPETARDAGLQLSFVAVLALAVAARYGPARSPRGTGTGIDLRAPLWQSCRCALAASLATAPLTAWHFGNVALWAPVATLLLGPVVTAALTTALLAAASCALPASCTTIFGPPLDLFLRMLESAARLGDRLPGTPLITPTASALPVALLAAAWLALLARRPLPALLLTAAGLVGSAGIRPPGATFTLLAVGHGQTALLKCGDRCDLFDAGGDGALPIDGVVRALHELGASRLDACILSHLDADHAGFAPELLATMEVGVLALPATAQSEFESSSEPLLVSLRTVARERGVPIRWLVAGDRLGPHECLWPPRSRAFAARNEGSLVLLARAGDRRLLLPGDLEGYPLLELAASIAAPVDLLVLPHHGNDDPGLVPLVERTGPELLLMSREERPPAGTTRRFLRECDLPWLSTGHGGAIGLAFPVDGAARIERGAACR